jgi:uncharacterized Zn finger protein
VAKGQGDRVERLIRDRLPRSRDSRLVEWLKRRAQARGDSAETLSLAESLFWQMPTLTGYKELKELAGPLGRWESLRSSILARLTQEKKYNLLTEIYLEENEIDQALQTVEQVNQQVLGGLYQFGSPLSIRVAQAAEPTRPREAICLYSNSIHQLINARGRENYATAVKYLLRVRDLYRRLDEEAAWQTLITNIREQNRGLRALKEELAKVKL